MFLFLYITTSPPRWSPIGIILAAVYFGVPFSENSMRQATVGQPPSPIPEVRRCVRFVGEGTKFDGDGRDVIVPVCQPLEVCFPRAIAFSRTQR